MQRQGAARAGALRLRLIIPGKEACRRAKRKRAGPRPDAGPPAAHADWCGGDGLASTCTHCSADGRSAELSLRHCSARLATSCGHSSGTLRQRGRFRVKFNASRVRFWPLLSAVTCEAMQQAAGGAAACGPAPPLQHRERMRRLGLALRWDRRASHAVSSTATGEQGAHFSGRR